MTRHVVSKQAALARARERRRAMDLERDQVDRQLETLAAELYLLDERYGEQQQTLAEVDAERGQVVAQMVELCGPERTAAFLDVGAAEVKRRVRRGGRAGHRAEPGPSVRQEESPEISRRDDS